MAIFNSYVCLPEGNWKYQNPFPICSIYGSLSFFIYVGDILKVNLSSMEHMALMTLDALFPTGAIEEILRKSWLSSCISAWKGRCHLGISWVAESMFWLYFSNGNSTLRPGTWGIYGECLFFFFQRFLKEIQDVPYAQEFFVLYI